jgi:hypothetical protein
MDEIRIVRAQGFKTKACAVAFDAGRKFAHEGNGFPGRGLEAEIAALAAAAVNERLAAQVAANGRQVLHEIQGPDPVFGLAEQAQVRVVVKQRMQPHHG